MAGPEPLIELHQGDCLDILTRLPSASVDAVIADMPYGTTHFAWDRPIPLAPLWGLLRRIIKPDAAIVLFGSQPFSSDLVVSNREWFRYAWAWKKSISGGIFNARYRPVKNHEDILVFSPASAAVGCKTRMKYRPQGLEPGTRIASRGPRGIPLSSPPGPGRRSMRIGSAIIRSRSSRSATTTGRTGD